MAVGCGGAGRWALALGVVLAAGAAAAAEEVRVCVIAIVATERNDKVDPKLTCIAREVQKKNPKLKGFTFTDLGCKSVTVGEPKEFKLPGDEVATITVRRAADEHNRVRLEVKPPRMKRISYETICGKFLAIMTPVHTGDGDVVILAVRVTPCHDD
jgi:hypothetical protein